MILNSSNFTKYLNSNYSFEKNPSVAVALSGGPDSMAMLHLLYEWNKKKKGMIIILIVDHGLRSNTKYEIQYILKEIKKYKLETNIFLVRKNQIQKKNMNEARVNRYKKLINYCKRYKILHLFVAHHKDDNIETYLNRKIAGSDFEGLASISEFSTLKKINIIRPLLNFSKKQIYNYNRLKNINFVEDPTNLNLNYTRPIIRNFLKFSNKNIIKNIENDFMTIRKNLSPYRYMINEILINNLIFINKNKVVLKYNKFTASNTLILEKIIKKLFEFLFGKEKHLRSTKIQNLISLIRKSRFNSYQLGNMVIKKDNDSLIFSRKTA